MIVSNSQTDALAHDIACFSRGYFVRVYLGIYSPRGQKILSKVANKDS